MNEQHEPTAQEREALVAPIRAHPAYRAAHRDQDFVASDAARPVRLQLELLKPEGYLRSHSVRSTIVVFGSARIPAPQAARSELERLRARGLVAFPGGYGTLDELFEALTLVRTRKIRRIPIVLVKREFWARAIDFDFLLAEGMIGEEDRRIFALVDSAEEAVAVLRAFYQDPPPD